MRSPTCKSTRVLISRTSKKYGDSQSADHSAGQAKKASGRPLVGGERGPARGAAPLDVGREAVPVAVAHMAKI